VTYESALPAGARGRPEAPFVFYRGRRGHFRWLSFAEVLAGEVAAAGRAEWAPPEAHELIRLARDTPVPAPQGDGLRLAPPPGERDVWISWRPLAGEERRLAAAAVASGAAIAVERREAFPVDLVLWARPTLLSAPAGDIAHLFERIDAEAPRWRRRAWCRQKLGRLRAVLVEGMVDPAAIERLAADLRRLYPEGAEGAATVRPFPPAGMPALV